MMRKIVLAVLFALPTLPLSGQETAFGDAICYACGPCLHHENGRELFSGGAGTITFEAPQQPIGCALVADCSYWTSQFPECGGALAAARETLDEVHAGRTDAVVKFAAANSDDVTLYETRALLILRTPCSDGNPVFALPVTLEQMPAVRDAIAGRRGRT